MTANGRSYGCPVEFSLDMIGGKWKTVILARVKEAPSTYGELRRLIPKLSDKVLTQRLRELEDAGFLSRRIAAGKARYALTERGRSLQPVLVALYDWGNRAAPIAGVRFDEQD